MGVQARRGDIRSAHQRLAARTDMHMDEFHVVEILPHVFLNLCFLSTRRASGIHPGGSREAQAESPVSAAPTTRARPDQIRPRKILLAVNKGVGAHLPECLAFPALGCSVRVMKILSTNPDWGIFGEYCSCHPFPAQPVVRSTFVSFYLSGSRRL